MLLDNMVNIYDMTWIIFQESIRYFFNPFATGDTYMHQHFHCLQWYAGTKWKG